MSTLATARSVYRPAPRATALLLGLAAIGGLTFVAGLFLAPDRVWPGFLMGFFYLTGLALSGLLFLAVLNLANAGWATALRRVPEAMAGVVPWAGVGGLLLLLGVPSLYEWSHETVVQEDALLQAKSGWLNFGMFAARLVLVFVLWWIFARACIARSQRQDRGEAGAGLRRRNLALSAAFMAVFAVTWSLASFDWVMSLEPHWYSTIFTLYTLAGLASAGLSAGIVVLIALRRSGALRGVVRDDHLHDLGRILLAFSVFWAYIWYCQYMLIWYTDIPEETTYYLARREGTWASLTPANLALNWLVPFLVLLPRAAKRSERVLVRVAWVVLVGHALDLYIMIGPPLMGAHPLLSVWVVAPVVGAVALFFWLVLRGLGQAPLVPLRDPYLKESLSYHA